MEIRALFLQSRAGPIYTLSLAIDRGSIVRIYSVVNPDKLRHLQARSY